MCLISNFVGINNTNMKNNIELWQLMKFSPYGLKCQYVGITNGAEKSKYEKDHKNDTDIESLFGLPLDIIGEKIGKIKRVNIYNNHSSVEIGIKTRGLKLFGLWDGDCGFKPVVRPLSDLKKDEYTFIYEDETDYDSICEFIHLDIESRLTDKFSFNFWEELFHYHFDIFGWIEIGLAIDINDLK